VLNKQILLGRRLAKAAAIEIEVSIADSNVSLRRNDDLRDINRSFGDGTRYTLD